MRLFICTVLLCNLLHAPGLFARDRPVQIRDWDATDVTLYRLIPTYPKEARERRISGNGIIRLFVDLRTGGVTGAEIEQSTGSAILDNAGLHALRQWRFKSAALRRLIKRYNPTYKSSEFAVRIPIRFTLER